MFSLFSVQHILSIFVHSRANHKLLLYGIYLFIGIRLNFKITSIILYFLFSIYCLDITVPGFKVFAKTSPNARFHFSVSENDRFGLVFAKTGSIYLGNG
jgi:hypothetical protein